MIPKIIHYCWLSKDPFPESINKCMESWKKKLPDYELMLWNFDRFPRGKSKWVDQAFEAHKYAFAADYIRLYALYNYGGIYLDSDVEVLKSFNNLLHLPYFLGQENTPSGIEAATIGCEKGNPLIKDMLDSYEEKVFLNSDGTYNTLPLPFIFRKCIEARYEYHCINDESQFDSNPNVVNVFPIDWFSPKHWMTKELNVTNNTFSIHHFAGSWLDDEAKEVDNEVKAIPICKKKSLLLRIKARLWYIIRKEAATNKYFAKIFFKFYSKNVYILGNTLMIFKSDYPFICKLNVPLIHNEIEFIKKEESRHKDIIHDFYPIMRIKDTLIEIHPFPNDNYVYTKAKCMVLLKTI